MDRLNQTSDSPEIILGLMSGTSLDGLDIAMVRWDTESLDSFELMAFETYPYDESLQNAIMASITGSAAEICGMNFRLGSVWAGYVEQFLENHGLRPEEISCIGSHGQTIWHISGESTLQMGEPAVISTRTGIPVVSNFREHDIAAGGTGAPLIPFLDWILFRDLPGNTVVLNIGGIGNITCISEGCTRDEVKGWDTGPGNMVVNTLVQLITHGQEDFDRDGALAQKGRIDHDLLGKLMDDPFVQQSPPKSTGREYYTDEYVRDLFPLDEADTDEARADLVATASEWTISAVASNVGAFWRPPESIDRVIVGGGGVHNQFFMERLASYFDNAEIVESGEFGTPVDAKEALGFAVFARAYRLRQPANLPGVTGAYRSVVLGKLTI